MSGMVRETGLPHSRDVERAVASRQTERDPIPPHTPSRRRRRRDHHRAGRRVQSRQGSRPAVRADWRRLHLHLHSRGWHCTAHLHRDRGVAPARAVARLRRSAHGHADSGRQLLVLHRGCRLCDSDPVAHPGQVHDRHLDEADRDDRLAPARNARHAVQRSAHRLRWQRQRMDASRAERSRPGSASRTAACSRARRRPREARRSPSRQAAAASPTRRRSPSR